MRGPTVYTPNVRRNEFVVLLAGGAATGLRSRRRIAIP
jgi:hypothetical protein